MKSLQAILYYCPHRRCMTLSSYFQKNLAFSTIIGPVMGFPSECTIINHLYNTLSNCENSGSFKVCCFVRPFTLSLTATNDHNWSLHFSVSQTVMICCFIKLQPHFAFHHFQASYYFKLPRNQSYVFPVSSCTLLSTYLGIF